MLRVENRRNMRYVTPNDASSLSSDKCPWACLSCFTRQSPCSVRFWLIILNCVNSRDDSVFLKNTKRMSDKRGERAFVMSFVLVPGTLCLLMEFSCFCYLLWDFFILSLRLSIVRASMLSNESRRENRKLKTNQNKRQVGGIVFVSNWKSL